MAKTTGKLIALVALLGAALGWSGVASAATTCSTCHAPVGSTTDIRPVDAAYRNISSGGFKGSHVKHIPAATLLATDCVACHGAAASYTVNHRNGSIEISGVGYSKGVSFAQSGNPVLGSCNAASCHDDGRGTLVTTPTWGTTAPACSVCHATVPATGSHSKHLSGTSYKTAVCADCHNGTVQSTTANPANHRNGTIDVYKTTPGDLGYPANKVKGSALATCATSYCHSSGQADDGSVIPVYAATPPTWGATVACGSCHTTTTRTSGSHAQHISQTIDCGSCHSGATATAYNSTTHVDGKIDVAAGFSYANQGTPGNGYSSCSATICHGSGAPTWGATPTVPVSGFPYSTVLCETCHGSATTNPFYSTAIPKNSLTTDAKTGAHTAHLTGASNISSAIACLECHTVPATTNASGHMNGTAQLTFGTLAKSQTTSAISCATTWCHGGNTTLLPLNSTARTAPVWNAPFAKTSVLGTGGPTGSSGSGYCAQCHGYPPLTANHTGKTTATCIGCHPHLNADALTFNDKTKHINGTIDAAGGHSFPYPGASHLTAAGTTPWTTCTGCHTNSPGGTYPVTAGTAPNCTACHSQGLKAPSGTSSCYDCHGSSATNGQPNGAIGTGIGGSTFPNYSGSHSAHVTKLALTCSNCHNGYGAGTASHGNSNRIAKTSANIAFSGLATTPTFTAPATCTAACHVAATWGSRLGCINCHSVAITRTKGRPGTQLSAVTTEFGLAWGHKKTGRGAVTDADCIVCHLEGNGTTLRTSAYHADGNIDLRDPDGAGETPISNISGAAFTFQRFSTSYAAGSRTTTGHTSNTDIANVITQKFCIKCHDANGATNTTARTTGGTAYMPWGGINLGATYTVANGAAAAGGVVNVDGQFATTNSSYHPVKGALNRDFPLSTRLAVPYNSQAAGRVAAGYTKSLSVVINCFDCHNTATPLTTRTVSAHGNSASLRGTIYATGAVSTLCTACHTGYTVSGTHGTGSAWSVTGSSHNVARNCQDCHGSYGTARPARPIGAQDYHGVNALVGGGLWPTVNSRPYAFIRAWSMNGGTANYHRPYRASEFTTGSATCGGGGACPSGGSGGQVGDGSTRTYTPGGSY